jgi:DNA (cytosine-5)-methyltransferase 3A
MKPRWFLFENVASMNEESKQVISELLGCQPIFIDSGTFGAQERPRYYWTNIPVHLPLPPESPFVLADILQPESEVDEKYYYNAPLLNINMDKQVCTTIDIRNQDIHRRVFNPKFKVHTLTCVSGGHQQKKVLVNGRCRKMTPIEYERAQTLPDNYTEGVSDGARYTACGNGWTVDVIAYLLKGLIHPCELA